MTCPTTKKEATMAKRVPEARRADDTAGTDPVYRSLFDSFTQDKDGRISPLEVLSRLERSGLRPGDGRIAEALAGLAGGDGMTHSKIAAPAVIAARGHRLHWHNEAACRDAAPELFFPDGDVSSVRAQVDTAKLICRGCPVSATCLNWALASGQQVGIWGGLRRRTTAAAPPWPPLSANRRPSLGGTS
jgi:WhiB family redox-sensing transcriptional regulator